MSVRNCSKQNNVVKSLAKTLDKNTMLTRKLLMKSVESKQEELRVAEGLYWDRAQGESREVRLVHSDRGDAVVCVVPDEGQDIIKTEDIMKQTQVPACVETAPNQQDSGVNVAGENAREHPGQGEKNLWVKHTIDKMGQQVYIISWVEVGKVEDLLGGTEWAMNVMINMLSLYMGYRQEEFKNFEEKAEEVASPGVVMSLKGLMDFSPCSAFSFTRRDPGVYHWLCSGPASFRTL